MRPPLLLSHLVSSEVGFLALVLLLLHPLIYGIGSLHVLMIIYFIASIVILDSLWEPITHRFSLR